MMWLRHWLIDYHLWYGDQYFKVKEVADTQVKSWYWHWKCQLCSNNIGLKRFAVGHFDTKGLAIGIHLCFWQDKYEILNEVQDILEVDKTHKYIVPDTNMKGIWIGDLVLKRKLESLCFPNMLPIGLKIQFYISVCHGHVQLTSSSESFNLENQSYWTHSGSSNPTFDFGGLTLKHWYFWSYDSKNLAPSLIAAYPSNTKS